MLKQVREALATQIHEGTQRKVNVYWARVGSPDSPAVIIEPHPEMYLDYWKTFGPNGKADVMLKLYIEVRGQDGPAVAELIDQMISVGENEPLSIIDPILADKSLGGVVDDCLPTVVRAADEYDGLAEVDVQIIVTKRNAEA